ncbi:hypothetical protein ACFSGX_07810 [Sphingomonas arantia]|uniref:Uncharacterized protein n=1 Tax=Sphingomonas arantia TaxID=1460676 RepID=A0ABW4TVE8_9SPHN
MQPQLNDSGGTAFTFKLTKLEQELSRVFGPQRARDKIIDRLIYGSLRTTSVEFMRVAYPQFDTVAWGGLQITYNEAVVPSTFWRGSHANGSPSNVDGTLPTTEEWDASVFETRTVVLGSDLPSDIRPHEQVAGFDEAEMIFIERATGIMCHDDEARRLLALFDVSTTTFIGAPRQRAAQVVQRLNPLPGTALDDIHDVRGEQVLPGESETGVSGVPAARQRVPSQDELISWFAAKSLTSYKPAWAAFKSVPEWEGGREHVFEPAWKEYRLSSRQKRAK